MQEREYPALYIAANKSSVGSQRVFIATICFQSALLIGGTFLGMLGINSQRMAVLSAVVFFLGIALTVAVAIRSYEARWYRARAVAESVKTTAWRYMMRAEPFNDLTPEEARREFGKKLSKILGEHKDISDDLGGLAALGDQISQRMRDVREADLSSRKGIYLVERIDEQRRWYADKSQKKKIWGYVWLGVLVLLQGAAAVFVLIRIASPRIEWPVEVLAVAASSALTWIQARRYRELASAYGLTAQEIGIAKSDADAVSSEQQFSVFVADAENAFSREHTQWIARKDVRT